MKIYKCYSFRKAILWKIQWCYFFYQKSHTQKDFIFSFYKHYIDFFDLKHLFRCCVFSFWWVFANFLSIMPNFTILQKAIFCLLIGKVQFENVYRWGKICLPQGECKFQINYVICNPYRTCEANLTSILVVYKCGFQRGLNNLNHLKSTRPLWNTIPKSSTTSA